jgi:tripartite-type tricarboxylate transporter receptor subunit TctC
VGAGEDAARHRGPAPRRNVKALASETVQGKLKNLGVEPMVMTPEEFDKRVAVEVANASVLAKEAGIAAQ